MAIYQAKPDPNFTVEEVDQMKTINKEMDVLGKEQEGLIDAQKSAVEIKPPNEGSGGSSEPRWLWLRRLQYGSLGKAACISH